MKIVDINTLKGSDRHGSCVECEKDFTEDKGMKRIKKISCNDYQSGQRLSSDHDRL